MVTVEHSLYGLDGEDEALVEVSIFGKSVLVEGQCDDQVVSLDVVPENTIVIFDANGILDQLLRTLLCLCQFFHDGLIVFALVVVKLLAVIESYFILLPLWNFFEIFRLRCLSICDLKLTYLIDLDKSTWFLDIYDVEEND